MKSIPPPKKKEKESQDDPAPSEEMSSHPPREESCSYASLWRVKSSHRVFGQEDPSTRFRCLRSRCPGRKEIPRRMKKIPGRIKIPRRIQVPQMCARNRQKSFLPEKNLQAEMSRSLSRTHVDRVTITKLFRRRLSADKCRGTPTWIGQSSHYSEATLSETWASTARMWTRSWVPFRCSDHPSPGPQCRLFSAAAMRRGFVPRQIPVRRKCGKKIDNSNSSLTNHCVCAKSPNKIQELEEESDANAGWRKIYLKLLLFFNYLYL